MYVLKFTTHATKKSKQKTPGVHKHRSAFKWPRDIKLINSVLIKIVTTKEPEMPLSDDKLQTVVTPTVHSGS